MGHSAEYRDSSTTKAVRGKAIGIELGKATRGGHKVPIIFPDDTFKPIGPWAAKFNTEVGIICRKYLDPSLDNWAHVPEEDKKHIEILIMKRSKINIENRSKLRVNHIAGSKSFVRLRHELRNPTTGMEPDRVAFYEATYFRSDKGTWVNTVAEERHNEMMALKSQPSQDGDTLLTTDEIYDKVLGKKSGYIRGLGHGVKPTPSSILGQTTRLVVEEARKREDEAEKRAQEAERRAEEAERHAHEAERYAQEAEKRSLKLGEQVQAHNSVIDDIKAKFSGFESMLAILTSRLPPVETRIRNG